MMPSDSSHSAYIFICTMRSSLRAFMNVGFGIWVFGIISMVPFGAVAIIERWMVGCAWSLNHDDLILGWLRIVCSCSWMVLVYQSRMDNGLIVEWYLFPEGEILLFLANFSVWSRWKYNTLVHEKHEAVYKTLFSKIPFWSLKTSRFFCSLMNITCAVKSW